MANETTPILPRQKRKKIDLATIIGLVCGFVLVLTAIFLGGDSKSFFDIRALLIVLGGTLAVVTMCFSLKEIAQTASVVMKTFVYSGRDASEAANHILEIAELSQKAASSPYKASLTPYRTNPFYTKALP